MLTHKKISVVTPCFNEEENVEQLINEVLIEFNKLNLPFEHIFIDNSSRDRTVEILRSLSKKFSHIRVIVNARNFGHIRSPYYGLMQAQGDAVILLAADLQDPPSVIPELIKKWQEGHDAVIAIKNQSLETPLMFLIRKIYYNLINKLADIELAKNYTGFGLYDQKIITALKKLNDPYPYFRGLIFELTGSIAKVYYTQPKRLRGITKNNFFTLYDIAMLGICSHSKIPLRIATMAGFLLSLLSLLVAFGYGVVKLIFWDKIPLGIAPLIVGLFFLFSVLLLFIGIIGEYIGFIYTKVNSLPLVIEKERINFNSVENP